ncbi:hypothetical protein DPMN_063402 [Dreissena polymorpha]|uniref:B box-type domain-containing protein n=1 Tax=Dreissena polymorpha TaxID=45954 RepID=A0A9D4CAG0_DREPO|nr:hypothetical protein DPMN_063402 [Dreissena polymorpha]
MASNMESSINRGCDFIFDFSCFTCQENDRNKEAEFYCEECSKFYCNKCVEHHNYLYKKHAILGKENISQWPETDVVELEQCQEHRKEKLTIFCEDHSQILCHVCHVHNHQKCSHVVLIADKVKVLHKKGDFKELLARFDAQHQQLIHKQRDLDENMKSLEKSYKTILEEINALRKTINDSLDELEKNTKKELDTFLVNTRTYVQNDVKNCTKSIKNIACLKDDWLRTKDKSEALSFIMYTKCHDHSLKVEAVLQEMRTQDERTLTFNPDTTIQQTLSALTGLGRIFSTVKQVKPAKGSTQSTVTRHNNSKASSHSDPDSDQTTPGFNINKSNKTSSLSRQHSPGNQKSDPTKSGQVSDPVSSSSYQLVKGYQPGAVSKSDQILRVKNGKNYSVKISKDNCPSIITGICYTATGELIIIDNGNCKVMLLDQTYKVVAHCHFLYQPWSMCSIDSSLVAVTVNRPEVHFIRVSNGQLIKDRILPLKHTCYGIAHQHGNLYITDGRALYHYTLDGRLVSKMYEDTSHQWIVTSCAVSPDGDRIYVTKEDSKQLVTLSRDGTVISTLTVRGLCSLGAACAGLHVTDSGQVLVCGYSTGIIYQVDRDGRQILAEMVTKNDIVTRPISIYYSKHTRSIIVGMQCIDNIIVFKEQ